MNSTDINILSVSELTRQIKAILESSFEKISVEGEVSNFTAHASGHWYFNLKDEGAVINCTMWRGLNELVFFKPQNGMKVRVNGRLTVFPPRGSYQLDVRSMKPAGIGELQAAFERLKEKLQAEGLFDPVHRKPIPVFPQKIGIITSGDGAALRDIISVASRRYPLVELIIAPTKVQGSGSAEEIVKNLKRLNSFSEIDVIIIARGGGSIEDLWSFNEEIVAREIFNSRIPVISGVGHEIDFTIADFVADLRAPTPSVAIELATPDKNELRNILLSNLEMLTDTIEEELEGKRSVLNNILSSYAFRFPLENISRLSQQVDYLVSSLQNLYTNILLINMNKLNIVNSRIDSFNMEKNLKRGYALIKQNSKFVTRKKNYDLLQPAIIKFFDGEVEIK